MSDLYDSLEEGSDDKRSCDSLDHVKAQAPNLSKSACKSKSMHHYSFYLNQNLTKNSLASFPYFSSAFNNASNNGQEKTVLPKIKNKLKFVKDPDPVQKLIVDNQILNKQGLQLNNDGSFTKSPRPDTEELPFFSREYKDLQFIRQKLSSSSKKAHSMKYEPKNFFSFTDNPVEGISMNAIISARKEKGSSEEILVSESSVSSSQSKATKHLTKEQNLTDSMKEKLLSRTSRESQLNLKGIGGLKNVKRDINILERNPQNKTTRFKPGDDFPNLFSKFQGLSNLVTSESGTKPKSVERKISRYKSDFAVNTGKPKLNYTERRQMQIGYNPLYLRLGFTSKKVPEDTSRSNFGDSMVDELPGISSRIPSVDNLLNGDEEMYYKKVIENDKNRQKRVARSSRSEGPVEFINLKDVVASSKRKEKKTSEVKSGKSSPRYKRITKSLSVDMPYKVDHSSSIFKKNSHLCLNGSSITWSKAELALKAKNYGYMVNARNIFKLKAKADIKSCSGKSSGRSGKSKSGKTYSQASPSLCFPSNKEKVKKRISLPENSLPKVKQDLFGGFLECSKRKRSPSGIKLPETSHKTFILPEVRDLSSRGIKLKTEMLEGISSCLKSPKR